jgi:hypothetical protein
VFVAYTGASVTRVFFISAASFGALSLYGYTTQRNLSAIGSFLIMGMFGLVIAMLVFLKSTGLDFVISALGVLPCQQYGNEIIFWPYIQGLPTFRLRFCSTMPRHGPGEAAGGL